MSENKIVLFYLDGNRAVIGRREFEDDDNFTIDKSMLCVIYYDRVPNKLQTGWDYLTTFSLQPIVGTSGPTTITVPKHHLIIDCTDESLKSIYESIINK